MTVIELINRLKEMPEDATIRFLDEWYQGNLDIKEVVLDNFEDVWLLTYNLYDT